jgi:subtilisin family serine protease
MHRRARNAARRRARLRRITPRPPLLTAAVAILLCVVAAWVGAAAAGGEDARLSPALASWLAHAHPDETVLVWVHLRYKAGGSTPALSPRAVRRRYLRAAETLGDPTDLPIAQEDMQDLARAGLAVRTASRWLRAVSGTVHARDLPALLALPQVLRVNPVGRRQWDPRESELRRVTAPPGDAPGPGEGWRPTSAFSDAQNAEVQIDSLQRLGYHGEGMLVGLLDTGYRRTHVALTGATVVAQYDFIHHDGVVDDEPGQDSDGQHNHGTETWSIIAGNAPGTFTGAAYRASFVLAKTENISSETKSEEDNWVAGLEWADSIGADVVSSSLGYSTFDSGVGSYTLADLNGHTAESTNAADMAVARGIVVVTAMGNEGNVLSWRKMLVPADGDSVLSIGAVDGGGTLASFSSIGPTADGRIKPDLVAMGVQDAVVNPNDPMAYGLVSGTSFSTPLVAGLCTLLLQAHPNWPPMTLRDALRMTATRSSSPDTLYGWGIPRGAAANTFIPVSVGDGREKVLAGLELGPVTPQPAHQRMQVQVALSLGERPTDGRAVIYSSAGTRVRELPVVLTRRGGRAGSPGAIRRTGGLLTWDLRDVRGKKVAPGLYLVRVEAGPHRAETRVVVLP